MVKNQVVAESDLKMAILESKLLGLVDLINRSEKSVQSIDQDIDTRYSKIERAMERIENKIWSLLVWMIGGFTSVFGLLAHIKGWI